MRRRAGIATVPQTVTTSMFYDLGLEIVGTNIRAFVSGDLKIQTTDATLSGGGRGGVHRLSTLTGSTSAAQICGMFAAYAAAIRALYLSAIVTAPVTVAWYLLQLVLEGEYDPTGLAVFAAFAGILLVPTVRAWRRLARLHELVPGERLRRRAWVAVPVAVLFLIALLALLYFFFLWYFANGGMERERGFFVHGLFAPGVLAYAIALPAGEALLVGRNGVRSI